ncbi:hypothetical protein F4778DRAFT_735852 [Xylariomycetidae sp. FL2044]|nr:hypothetical protein F4778DRAFT_735852 [Xylariomycetidae sp. FL2044]
MDDRVGIPLSTHVHGSLSDDVSLCKDRRSSTTPPTSAHSTHEVSATCTFVDPLDTYLVPPYHSYLHTPVSVAGSPSLSIGITNSGIRNEGKSQQPISPGASSPKGTETASSSAPVTSRPPAEDGHTLETSYSLEAHGRIPDPAPHLHWGVCNDYSPALQDDMLPRTTGRSVIPVQDFTLIPSALVRTSMDEKATAYKTLAPAAPRVPIQQHYPHSPGLVRSMTLTEKPQHHFACKRPNLPPGTGLAPATCTSNKAKPEKRRRSGRLPKGRRCPDGALGPGAGQRILGKAKMTCSGPNSSGSLTKRLALGPEASEQDVFLLYLRYELEKDKGKGMWDRITREFQERLVKKSKASLQMQLSRSVLKHAKWPAYEDDALKRAVKELVRNRHTELQKLMKEHGGCQAWDWREDHIAKRLSELYIERFGKSNHHTNARRQNKSNTRKSSSRRKVSVLNLACQDDIPSATSQQEEDLLEQSCKREHETPEPYLMGGAMKRPLSVGAT